MKRWAGGSPNDGTCTHFCSASLDVSTTRGATPKKTDAGVPLVTARNVKRGYISTTPLPMEFAGV